MRTRHSIFIGSSSEGLPVASAIQSGMTDIADAALWTQGIFQPSFGFLESLTEALEVSDFAVLILTTDDVTESRGIELAAPRDNVIFELGLCIGHLGRERSLFVYDSSAPPKLPTDLLGIAAVTYTPRADGNLDAAVGPVCHQIKKRIAKLGARTRMLKFAPHQLQDTPGSPNLSGTWAGYSPEGPAPQQRNATLTIEQHGAFARATIVRDVPAGGQRVFEYEGRYTSGQLVLFFEEREGPGYIVGTMVLHLSHDLRSLVGRSTFFNHEQGQVVSAARRYERE